MPRQLYALALLFLLTSPAYAEPLWQSVAVPSARANSIVLPPIAVDAQSITVSAVVLAQLEVGDDLSIPLNGGELHYQVSHLTTFMSGDQGVQAAHESAGSYVLSLTYNADDLVATIYSPEGTLSLLARRIGASYEGYLFRESDQVIMLPADQGAVPADYSPRGQLSFFNLVGNSDVTIAQTFNEKVLTIGGSVTGTVEIVNNTNAVISGKTLVVFDIFDKSEYK